MTSLENFVQQPFKNEVIHRIYRESFLYMRPAPEVANGEQVLASLYRHVGFNGVSEKMVPINGRKLQKHLLPNLDRQHNNAESTDKHLTKDNFHNLISNLISSPKLPNQSGKRFLQIGPIVPDAAVYSLSPRLGGNPWNPGALIASMVCFGSSEISGALEVWKDIFSNLTVTSDDDPWARILQDEFSHFRPEAVEGNWEAPQQIPNQDSLNTGLSGLSSPAARFVKDLKAIMSIKKQVTRRQWISMFEAVLRIGSAAHILWLCEINRRCLDVLETAVKEERMFTSEELIERFSSVSYWGLNQPTNKVIEEFSREFLRARVGINLLFYFVSEIKSLADENLSSIDELSKLSEVLSKLGSNFDFKKYEQQLGEIIESNHKSFSCKSGIPKNILEFVGHVLRRRETAENGMKSYDQGYFVKRKGGKNSVWISGFGPVAAMALVHSCTFNRSGTCNIADLRNHLSEYGFAISVSDLVEGETGSLLRNLGLVLDSPDAEGGMILKPPFRDDKSNLREADVS